MLEYQPIPSGKNVADIFVDLVAWLQPGQTKVSHIASNSHWAVSLLGTMAMLSISKSCGLTGTIAMDTVEEE